MRNACIIRPQSWCCRTWDTCYIPCDFKFKNHEAIVDEAVYFCMCVSALKCSPFALPTESMTSPYSARFDSAPGFTVLCSVLFPPQTSETDGDIFPPCSSVPSLWFSCLLIDITLSESKYKKWMTSCRVGRRWAIAFLLWTLWIPNVPWYHKTIFSAHNVG